MCHTQVSLDSSQPVSVAENEVKINLETNKLSAMKRIFNRIPHSDVSFDKYYIRKALIQQWPVEPSTIHFAARLAPQSW